MPWYTICLLIVGIVAVFAAAVWRNNHSTYKDFRHIFGVDYPDKKTVSADVRKAVVFRITDKRNELAQMAKENEKLRADIEVMPRATGEEVLSYLAQKEEYAKHTKRLDRVRSEFDGWCFMVNGAGMYAEVAAVGWTPPVEDFDGR